MTNKNSFGFRRSWLTALTDAEGRRMSESALVPMPSTTTFSFAPSPGSSTTALLSGSIQSMMQQAFVSIRSAFEYIPYHMMVDYPRSGLAPLYATPIRFNCYGVTFESTCDLRQISEGRISRADALLLSWTNAWQRRFE